ncbi:uncharacterized protein I206_107639 [Kwoniella pini CBS 10737]|uniref:U4/U6.U5 small nuclear ribonucleoprotein 27kDa protein domain-containing protein n=1 Tax=Kwoniella pini CBS 10737 TaxID=1296096 RepID=A0A1B9HXV3_9TREE|nr:uncharacterized protein I206_05974 [Kwoniella pini CBS 10737]OCF48106.1 hypothetical protein I206_05974 [Kwoniella pini CBS 10737]
MSSRAAPYGSPRDKDSRYGKDDRDGLTTRARSRSRSPRRDRDRYDERDRNYGRDSGRSSNRDDRSRRDYDSPRDRERDRRDEYSRDDKRDYRDRDGKRDDYSRETRSPAVRDVPFRDSSRSGNSRDNPNNDPNYRPSPKPYESRPPAGVAPAQPRAGPSQMQGYRQNNGGGNGGYGNGGGEYDRPLDRRAIEEGRRRREEERAKGVVYTEGGAYDPGAEDSLAPQDEPEDEIDPDDPEAQMAAMMGFGGFGTSKGQGKEDNIDVVAKVNKQRTWRQYMNRRGGFNRPLDKIK